jgi:hypothetical protein
MGEVLINLLHVLREKTQELRRFYEAYLGGADTGEHRRRLDLEEGIHQASRDIMFEYANAPSNHVYTRACVNAIRRTIGLLREPYAEFQRDRIEDLLRFEPILRSL